MCTSWIFGMAQASISWMVLTGLVLVGVWLLRAVVIEVLSMTRRRD